MKNKKLIFTEIVLLFCIIFASVAGMRTISADDTPEIQTAPQSQDGLLDPGNYQYLVGSASGGDDIIWSFVGTQTLVGIYAMALDYDNFWDFYDGY